MSMYLNFEPHSWYKYFAIKNNRISEWAKIGKEDKWQAYTDNGMSGYIDVQSGATLKELKNNITAYHKAIAERDTYNRKLIGE